MFDFRTAKKRAKGEKRLPLAGWCNGRHGKAKHDFSWGVFGLHNFRVWQNTLACTFPGLYSLSIFLVGGSYG
jgi:hypothetical protein